MNKDLYNYYFKILKSANYPTQDHWDIFNNDYYNKVKDFNEMLDFRINGISNMLETGLPSQERFSLIKSGKKYTVDYNQDEAEEILKRFNELQEMLGSDLFKIQFNNLVGSPRRLEREYNGKNFLLNFDDLYHVYGAWQVKRFIDLYKDVKKINSIVEIGAGYGNLAHKIKSVYSKCKYFIIDLPEVLLIQHYYLSQNNPSYKIVNLLDPIQNISENQDGDIFLIPFSRYNDVKIDFDMAINHRSFGEMPKQILFNYIKWIEKNISESGLLYTVNRYVFTKSKDKNKIRNYPFDDFWKPIVSQPQWLQTHLHEFLLKRTPDKSFPSMEFVLNSFPLSTPPPGPMMEKIQTQPDWIKNQKIS
jgi:putative sugar O-methyltransferase